MTESTSTDEPVHNPYASPKSAYYALGLLTVVYSFNFIDLVGFRQFLTLPISYQSPRNDLASGPNGSLTL